MRLPAQKQSLGSVTFFGLNKGHNNPCNMVLGSKWVYMEIQYTVSTQYKVHVLVVTKDQRADTLKPLQPS